MTSPNRDNSELIEAYLDGLLSDADRADFERRCEADKELRVELDLAERIEDSLNRSFSPPGVVEVPPDKNGRWRIGSPRQLGLMLAAAAAVLAIGVAIKLNLPKPAHDFNTLLERVYTTHEMNDFEPEWVCESDQEFADAVSERLGQPMLVDPADAGVEVLGWAYADDESGYGDTIISEKTMLLLVRVDGQGAYVIVDRLDAELSALTIGDHLGLSLHRMALDDLVLYEVTPHAEARVLPRVFRPAAEAPEGPVEGAKSPSGNG